MKRNWNRIRTAGALLAVTTSLTFAAPADASTAVPPTPSNGGVPPLLTLQVKPVSVTEGEQTLVSGSLARALADDLVVELWFAGDAGPEDFDAQDVRLVFAAGETEATIQITALEDFAIEGTENLVIGSDDPAVRLAGKATLAITEPPVRPVTRQNLGERSAASCQAAPGIWLEATSKGVAEGGGSERLTLHLSAPACDHLSFPIEVDRIPVPADLVFSAPSFEIPAGALTGEVEVRGLDDSDDEPLEQYVVRVQPLSGGDQHSSVTLLVEDNDADVALGSLIGLADVVAGRRAQFQIEVTNPGFKDLAKVALLETAVEGLTDVEWVCFGKSGAVCPVKGENFVQLTASMPAKSAIVVVVDALVESSRRDALLHRASVAVLDGSLSDPDPSDNEAMASHEVDVMADLELDLEVAPWDPKGTDPALTYTLVVRNLGPSDAAGAVVTSPLGGHLVWAEGDPDCGADDASVTCDLDALAAGAERELEMVLSVLAPYPAFTIQEAWLDPSDLDPYQKNNEAALETKLDLFVPTLEEVVAVGTDGSEGLGACSQLVEAPVRLELRFSEELVGGGAPGDVDSIESYRLYAPGPDGEFEISSCGDSHSEDPGTDDVEITLLAARWNAKTATVELDIKSSPLQALDGFRRLIACETLRDFGENPIDGDGDGNPGDAAVRGFRIDAGNLVRNGHFDCDLDGWSALAPTPQDWTLGADAAGSSLSASSRIDNSAAWPTVGVGVCVPTLGSSQFELRLRHRLSPVKTGSGEELGSDPILEAAVDVVCTPYPSVSCTGEALGGEGFRPTFRSERPAAAAWTSVVRTIETPKDGTGSLLCTVSATGEYAPFVLEVDDVRLRALDRDATTWPTRGNGGRPASTH